jgi:hypothetical protein
MSAIAGGDDPATFTSDGVDRIHFGPDRHGMGRDPHRRPLGGSIALDRGANQWRKGVRPCT